MTNYFQAFKDFEKQKTKTVGQKTKAYKKHKCAGRIPDFKEQTGNCKDGGKQTGSRQMGLLFFLHKQSKKDTFYCIIMLSTKK